MRPVPDEATLRAFLAHTIAVLHDATGVAARVEPRPCALLVDHGAGIAIAIRVRGHLSGLTWTFPTALARDAALHMVPGCDPAHELCIAAASELANILTGRGLPALESHGVVIELEAPEQVAAALPGTVAHLATRHGVVEVVFHPLAPAEAPC